MGVSETMNMNVIDTYYVGMLVNVDLNSGSQSCVYMNFKGDIVPVVNPFAEYTYGTEPIVTTLK